MHHKRNLIAIGDVAEAVLSRIGITKERVSAVLGKPCNCGSRQSRLNQAGYIAQYQAIKAAAAVQRFFFGD
jgi:hypothetical protein